MHVDEVYKLIGRQQVNIGELRDEVAGLRAKYGELLTILRRAQDGDFASVVVDLDKLTYHCTEKPKAEEAPANTESEP